MAPLTLLLDSTVLRADGGQTDLYDPATATFTPTAPLPTHVDAITAVRLGDGRVLIVGGARGSTAASMIYVPATRSWLPAANLNFSHSYSTWKRGTAWPTAWSW